MEMEIGRRHSLRERGRGGTLCDQMVYTTRSILQALLGTTALLVRLTFLRAFVTFLFCKQPALQAKDLLRGGYTSDHPLQSYGGAT